MAYILQWKRLIDVSIKLQFILYTERTDIYFADVSKNLAWHRSEYNFVEPYK